MYHDNLAMSCMKNASFKIKLIIRSLLTKANLSVSIIMPAGNMDSTILYFYTLEKVKEKY